MIQDRGATGHGDGPKETRVDLNGSDGDEATLMLGQWHSDDVRCTIVRDDARFECTGKWDWRWMGKGRVLICSRIKIKLGVCMYRNAFGAIQVSADPV